MPAWRFFAVAFLVEGIFGATAGFLEHRDSVNPIRKVVNLLQAFQQKATEEGEKDEDLHQKSYCFCPKSEGNLGASKSAAETKVLDVYSKTKSASAQKATLEADARAHQVDRHAAKAAMAQATAIREKEFATYNKNLGDNKHHAAAIQAAGAALEKGMVGQLLQSSSAAKLLVLLSDKQDMVTADRRQEVLAFLSGGRSSEYAPSSAELAKILKGMADKTTANQKGLIDTEKDAVKVYNGLMKEIAALIQRGSDPPPQEGDCLACQSPEECMACRNPKVPKVARPKGSTCIMCGLLITSLFGLCGCWLSHFGTG